MNAIKPADGIGNKIDKGPRYHIEPHNGRSIDSGNAGFRSHLDGILAQNNGPGPRQVELPRELRTLGIMNVFVSEGGSVLIPSTVCTAYSSANSTEEQKPNNVWYG